MKVILNLVTLSVCALQRFTAKFEMKSKLMNPANKKVLYTVVLIRDQTRSVAKQVSVAVGWVKIEISLMAQLKGLTAKFKLM